MIGKRIKDARLLRGHTQESLAELIDMSVMQISRYETDKSLPSVNAIVKIAEGLNVSLDYLVGISDIYDPYQGVGLSDAERHVIEAWRHGDKLQAINVISSE